MAAFALWTIIVLKCPVGICPTIMGAESGSGKKRPDPLNRIKQINIPTKLCIPNVQALESSSFNSAMLTAASGETLN